MASESSTTSTRACAGVAEEPGAFITPSSARPAAGVVRLAEGLLKPRSDDGILQLGFSRRRHRRSGSRHAVSIPDPMKEPHMSRQQDDPFFCTPTGDITVAEVETGPRRRWIPATAVIGGVLVTAALTGAGIASA